MVMLKQVHTEARESRGRKKPLGRPEHPSGPVLPVTQGQGVGDEALCQLEEPVHLGDAVLVVSREALAYVCEVARARVQVALVQPVPRVAPGRVFVSKLQSGVSRVAPAVRRQ